MGRGSDKHNPLLDDALKKETEPIERSAHAGSRVEEFRITEPVETTDGAPRDSTELRSLIARTFPRTVFPATRDGLLEAAGRENAPAAIVEAVRRLAADESFANPHEIWVALGGDPEER